MADPLLDFVSSVCVQTAVYWGNPTPDGYGGYTFDDPVEIDCRWDGSTEMIRSSDGKEVLSKARLLLTQDVDEGGIIFLGSLDDLDSDEEEAPRKSADAWEILRFDKTPLFQSSTEFVREVYV